MKANEIAAAILTSDLTNDDFNAIYDALKLSRENLAKKAKLQFRVGSKVKFTSNRNGKTFTGSVKKVKIKNIEVLTDCGIRYNVPANMLEAA